MLRRDDESVNNSTEKKNLDATKNSVIKRCDENSKMQILLHY